jgi:hypothetical protein
MGRCGRCSSPGTEIDHINGDSSDPASLRLLCHRRHVGVTLSHNHHAPAKTDAEIDATFAEITAGSTARLRRGPATQRTGSPPGAPGR